MADIVRRQGSGVPEGMYSRYRDKLDSTHALVIAADIGVNGADASEANPIPIDDIWALALQEDVLLADSDKLFTVPAGYMWQVLWIWVEMTTTAAPADRQLEIDFQSATAVIGEVRPNAQQGTGTLRNYLIAPAIANLAAFYDTNHLQTPLPPTIFLPAGYSVRIFDNNVVDLGGDNMIVRMMVAQKAV